MKILNFRSRVRTPPAAGRTLASIDRVLAECRGRQAAIRDDGRRLGALLERLSLLTEDLIRGSERLRHTVDRLRAGPIDPGTRDPRE